MLLRPGDRGVAELVVQGVAVRPDETIIVSNPSEDGFVAELKLVEFDSGLGSAPSTRRAS